MYPQATRRLSLFIFMALTILSALIVGYAVAKLLRGSTPTYTTTRATPEFEAEQFTRQTAVLGASEDDPLTTTAEVAATFFSPPPVTETATVAPTAVPTLVEALDRFVEDDFEDATTGWLERETTTSRAQYDGGRYRLMLNGQLGMSVSSTLPTENYRLRADVAAEQGNAGIVFMSAKPTTFYRMLINTTGQFAVQVQQGTALSSNVVDWTASPALNQGAGAINRLTIERQGSQVRLYANDQPLFDAVILIAPGSFTGQYGFVLTSEDGQGQASFDNLVGERLPAQP